ncbi:response regulator [Pricia sp. S334]|uniref:Response regulator n=1 Tax=Pricia mediterranea TaxID=3076079 RepID=A0ABU3L545_9FLAO|nr:response regulator [Pricia sp. S334]MDT7828845.1 response regulator [Pricia sp. S334]
MSKDSIRIFLVDDDEDDRDLFKDAINEIPLKTRINTFTSGIELISLLEHENHNWPQLIFLDLNMPIMGGEECLQRLRSIPKLDSMPIIVYSTIVVDSLADRLSEIGANMYLQKPSSFPQLKSLLEQCITSVLQTKGEGKYPDQFIVREDR